MAVLEVNGKPIPAAPNPQPAPTLSEIPRESFPIFSGGETLRRRPVRVRRDPGTLSYIPYPIHCHHGTLPQTQEASTVNQPPTSPFELRRQSARQQQLTNDHRHYSIQHQHQTNNRHHLTHAQRTTLANRPELRNKKSQEINDNSFLNSNYTTGTQPQPITTTNYPDCFTPIVSDSRQKNKIHSNSTFTQQQNPDPDHQPATKITKSP